MMYLLTEEEYQALKKEAISQTVMANQLFEKWINTFKHLLLKEAKKTLDFDVQTLSNHDSDKWCRIILNTIDQCKDIDIDA